MGFWHLIFRRFFPLTLVLSCLAVLSACDGDDGAAGPPGPTPGIDIANAAEINAVINSVTISSPPVVEFSLDDGNGNSVRNLPAAALGFQIAKLVPGTDGNASYWQSYINRIEEPGVGPGTEPQVQATTESGAAGTLVDHADGSYTYTFALDVTAVTDPIEVRYDPGLTHRVTFEIRGFAPVRNPIYDFRPADHATTGLFTREIAGTDSCNGCHENLSLHGGARFEMQECVVCHNPGSADANSGHTLDMTVMTHKIHYGEDLPGVIGGTDYCIWGFGDSIHCYGDVVYPQDILNCRGCHAAEDPETPDAANWYTTPTAEACGSCHEDVNFATGENHGPGIPADNTTCADCHASNPDSAIEVRQAHRMPAVERAANYRFNIEMIDFAGAGFAPTVTFSVTNPLNDDTPYDMANDADLKASPLSFFVAWNTADYSNVGNGADNARPEQTSVYDSGILQASDNGDFTYTLELGQVVPVATGSGVVTFEGYVSSDDGEIPVATAHKYFGITDDPMDPVARRASVDIERCNDCHAITAFHDTRIDSFESCQICHHADAARGGSPSRGPMDMKHFIHRNHAVDDIKYPQRTDNCVACHTGDGYFPVPNDGGVLATSTNRGTLAADPTDNNRISPNSAACGVCHTSGDAQAHSVQYGGSFDACQETDKTLRVRVDICGPGGDKSGALVLETCSVCHGPGRSADTGIAHGILSN